MLKIFLIGNKVVAMLTGVHLTIKCCETFTRWLFRREQAERVQGLRVRCFSVPIASECKKFK